MRKFFIQYSFLLFFMLANVLLCPSMEARASVASRDSFISQLPLWMEQSWREYYLHLKSGQWEKATELMEWIQEKALLEGTRRFDIFSSILIYEGDKALSENRVGDAVRWGQAARNWSPKNPDASFFLSRALFRENPFIPLGAIKSNIEGIRLTNGDFWPSYVLSGRITLLGFLGLSGGFILFTLFLLIRFLPLWVHRFIEFDVVKASNAWAFAAIIIFTPLLMGAGPGIAVLICLGLAWGYMTWNNKLISSLFVLIVSLSGFWLAPTLSFFILENPGEIDLLADTTQGVAKATGSARALELNGDYAREWPILTSLGLHYKRLGDYPKALALYNEAKALAPQEPILDTNIGNVYFVLNQHDDAISAYQQALLQNPESVTTHFNLNIVYQELLRFDEATEEIQAARELHPDLTRDYESRGKVVIDEPPSFEFLWEKIYQASALKEQRAEALFAWGFSPLSNNQSWWVIPIFATGIALMRISASSRHKALPCSICGIPICYRCQRRLLDLKVCQACLGQTKNITRKTDLRELKKRKVRLQKIALILSIFLPGTGHLYLQKSIRGFLFSAIFIVLLASLFMIPWLGQGIGIETNILGPGSNFFIGITLLALYVEVFRELFKPPNEIQ